MTRLAPKVHCAAHARHHLAGDHPVGEMSFGVDLQAAEHGDVNMAAPDQGEGHRAVEGRGAGEGADWPTAGISQQGVRHALLGDRPGADQPVLRLKEHVEPWRHVVRDQRRNPNAEIDQHARRQLPGDATRDDRLRLHSRPR